MSAENFDVVRHWRIRRQRYRLVGEVCHQCCEKLFPPRDICPNCKTETKELFFFSGRGEVYSFTKVYEAPRGFEETVPYYLALVRLDEGPLITAQLTDFEEDEIKIGLRVEMVTRRLSRISEAGFVKYGYKFRPLLTTQSKKT